MKRIYLDHASTTPLDPRVGRVMEPFFTKEFGNSSSIHAEGVAAKKAMDEARVKTARCLEAHAEEIVFTSGGTEANNLAIFGVLSPLQKGALPSSAGGLSTTPALVRTNFAEQNLRGRADSGTPFAKGDKPHVVTTNIEHASVLEPLRELERQGRAEVTYVPVESNGIVQPEKIIAAVRPNTVLISVMYANNEIGTIQPIAKIGKALRYFRNRCVKDKGLRIKDYRGERYPLFHTDACQAPHCLVNALGIDLLSLDGHKLYGPKGVGALYVRRGTPIAAQILGGGQERGLRSTTENVSAAVGFAEALRIAVAEREKESIRVAKLRDQLCADVLENISTTVVNGSMEKGERLPNNLNISLPGVDTEFLTLQLDAAGIAVSTKSSCLRDEKESYVVKALSGDKKRAASTLRFTLGRWTTKWEVEYTAQVLKRLLVAFGQGIIN